MENTSSEKKISIDPIKNAVLTLAFTNNATGKHDGINLTQIEHDLRQQITNMQNCDTTQIEAMLYSQAILLQEMSFKILKVMWTTDQSNYFHAFGSLALKAQNQSRSTLSTLASIKNPQHATFIKQQNNAVTQQVNNATALPKKINPLKNELLNEVKNEALDIGRTSKTISINTSVDTMEEINGC